MKRVFLGIGTNLGDRENNLKKAVEKIEEFIGRINASSSVYETEPWGFRSENDFLNMAVEVETELKPSGLLGRLLMIESLLGRLREGKEYASRIIDIDILFYGDNIIETKALTVPHPRIPERKFVLVPLCEIAPDLVHPVIKKSIQTLLKKCPDKNKVRKYSK
jgi:2-amino-4-hydroxy-6-hydroxymethyldihydropteridine diphosphokinase